MNTIVETLLALPVDDPLLDLTVGSLVSKRVCEIQMTATPRYLDTSAWYCLRGYSLCCARADQLYLEMISLMRQDQWGRALPTIHTFLQMDKESKQFEQRFMTHPQIQAPEWRTSPDFPLSFWALEESIYHQLAQEVHRPDLLKVIRQSRYDPRIDRDYQAYVNHLDQYMNQVFEK